MRDKNESENHRGPKSEAADNDGTSELLDKGRKIASDSLKTAEELYGDALKEATKLVRKHPLEAMAVTFGIGCLVGLIITRR